MISQESVSGSLHLPTDPKAMETRSPVKDETINRLAVSIIAHFNNEANQHRIDELSDRRDKIVD